MEPSLAVVVVNANSGELLGRALDALERQTVPPSRTIVVDNASTDGSLEAAAGRAGVEIVQLPENVGFAAANNLAVQRASECEWIALLNPDAFPEPDWLEELLAAAAANPGYAFFASRLVDARDPARLDGTGDLYHVSGWAWQRDHGRPQADVADAAPHEVFAPCAAAALYRRQAYVDAGGFDETYFCYYEDVDLAFRLRLAGHRCLYVPLSAVHHVGSAIAGRESDFAIYHAHRNLVWTYFKNMPAPLLVLYLPHHVTVNLLALAWFSARGHARAIVRAKRDAFRALPRVLAGRRRIQEGRRTGPRELRRAMARGLSGYASAFRLARKA